MDVWNAEGTGAGTVGEIVAGDMPGPACAAGWWEVSASIIGLCTVCVLRRAVEA